MVSGSEGQLSATNSTNAPPDRIERLPFGERWMPDAWELFHVPGGFGLALVDMTQLKKALRILRDGKIAATYPHLIVRAVALAYARNPAALQIVCNYQRLRPGSLDVGLSMAGQTSYAVDAAAAREAGDLKTLYRWAIPFRWMRRWILSVLHRSLKFRTRIVGHFQVTCLPNVDMVVPLVFYSSAILGVGAIRDRVIASDGVPVVRPTVWLSGVADHASTDGLNGGDALQAIKDVLEGDELVREAQDAVARKAAAKANKAGARSLPAGPSADAEPPRDGTV
jgi:hypothetical protein